MKVKYQMLFKISIAGCGFVTSLTAFESNLWGGVFFALVGYTFADKFIERGKWAQPTKR